MKNILLGAICGDVCGSTYEHNRTKNIDDVDIFTEKSTFTDDTIGTIATADVLLHGGTYADSYQKWFRKYKARGCGHLFRTWVFDDDPHPYNSWGNGSAMRCSPIGYIGDTLGEVWLMAEESAKCTHNHPEGIKGAKAISSAIWLAYYGSKQSELTKYVLEKFYPKWIDLTLDEIRPDYKFDSSCAGSVPVAIIAFKESTDYVDCIKKAISMGGDADTLAAMAGSVAHAYFRDIPDDLVDFVKERLPKEMLNIIEEFDDYVSNAV